MKKQSIITVMFLVILTLTCIEVSSAESFYMAGVNINGQWDTAYELPDAIRIAEWLPSINANWASIQVTLWQQERDSNEVWEATTRGSSGCRTLSPSQGSIKKYIELLHDKGLKVSLKIHVKVVGKCDGWSGKINPDSPEVWFQNYQSKLMEYVAIAQEMNVEMFAFGNELAGVSKGYRQEWGNIINAIKSKYKGKLVYCATFPNDSYIDDAEYAKVVFWDLVDYIGINLWPQASQEQTPSVDQIKEKYDVFRKKLDDWYDREEFNKKIIITEFGAPNTDKCVEKPQDAWANGGINERCQANAYEAFFQVFSTDQRIVGMFSHEDIVDHLNDDKYQVRNREAEDIIARDFLLSAQLSSNVLPSPTGQSAWDYAAVMNPIKEANPAECRPFAVGNLPYGILNLQVGLPAFSEGVDVYLAIQSDAISEMLYLINKNNEAIPASTVIPPWKTNVFTDINESLWGDIPIYGLPPGLYNLYLAVTPARGFDFSNYYFWSTSFNIE